MTQCRGSNANRGVTVSGTKRCIRILESIPVYPEEKSPYEIANGLKGISSETIVATVSSVSAYIALIAESDDGKLCFADDEYKKDAIRKMRRRLYRLNSMSKSGIK